MTELVEESPSLKQYLEEAFQRAFAKGVILALGETNLSSRTFPAECPYNLTEILDNSFYPGEPSELVSELE